MTVEAGAKRVDSNEDWKRQRAGWSDNTGEKLDLQGCSSVEELLNKAKNEINKEGA